METGQYYKSKELIFPHRMDLTAQHCSWLSISHFSPKATSYFSPRTYNYRVSLNPESQVVFPLPISRWGIESSFPPLSLVQANVHELRPWTYRELPLSPRILMTSFSFTFKEEPQRETISSPSVRNERQAGFIRGMFSNSALGVPCFLPSYLSASPWSKISVLNDLILQRPWLLITSPSVWLHHWTR